MRLRRYYQIAAKLAPDWPNPKFHLKTIEMHYQRKLEAETFKNYVPNCKDEGRRIYFVNSGGNGSGRSWYDAFGSLQEALQIAEEGDQIWVAKGIYYPTDYDDRNASFNIPRGVEVYGGFAGDETAIYSRDARNNITILSGEIGDEESKEDNSFSVVYFSNSCEETILDGFTITWWFCKWNQYSRNVYESGRWGIQ